VPAELSTLPYCLSGRSSTEWYDVPMATAAPVRSVQDFQKAINQVRSPLNTHIRLYRGQGEAKNLLPSLFRIFSDRVHLILETEARMLERLKKRIPQRTPLRPTNDWDWLSFGQHYWLPTRLLDWSADPLIALFFAVEKTPISPTVYIYHAQKSQIVDARAKNHSPASITLTRIMEPAVHSVRVKLQKGWHTVHRLHPRKSGGKMVIPLADLEWHKGRLAVVGIDPTRAPTIRGELAGMGIYRATVYGDFENVCGSIWRECGVHA